MEQFNRNPLEEIKNIIQDLRKERKELRDAAGEMIDILDRAVYNERVFSRVKDCAEQTINLSEECFRLINSDENKKLSRALNKVVSASGSFDANDPNCYAPDALSFVVEAYEDASRREEEEKTRKQEIFDRFGLLVLKDTEKYRDQQKLLEEAQSIENRKEECIQAYDIFYQCVLEEDAERIADIVDENRKALEYIFYPRPFPAIERALYLHRIKVREVADTEGKETSDADVSVSTIEDYGIDCDRMESLIIRDPKPASTLIKDFRQGNTASKHAFVIAVSMSLSYPEFTIELLRKTTECNGLNDIGNAVEYLYKKGYLMRHYLPDKVAGVPYLPAYAATSAGRAVLLQKSVKDEFGFSINNRDSMNNGINTYNPAKQTPVGFLRVSVLLKVIEKLMDCTGCGWNELPFFWVDGRDVYPIVFYAQKGKKATLFIPAIASKNETNVLERCCNTLESILTSEAVSTANVLIVALPGQESVAEAWAKVIRRRLPDRQFSLFCGTTELNIVTEMGVSDDPGKTVEVSSLLTDYIGGKKEDENIPDGNVEENFEEKKNAANGEESSESFPTDEKYGNESEKTQDEKPRELKKEIPVGYKKDTTSDEAEIDAKEQNTTEGNTEEDRTLMVEQDTEDWLQKKTNNDIIRQGFECIANKELAKGLVLLRSAEGLKNEDGNSYILFAAAAGDPMLQHEIVNDPSHIDYGWMFNRSTESPAIGCLQYCYQLRRLTLDNNESFNLKGAETAPYFIFDNKIAGSADKLLTTLREYGSSISISDIEACQETDKVDSSFIAARAKELNEHVKTLAQRTGNRVRSTRDGLLGSGSEIWNVLDRIAKNENSSNLRGTCKEILNRYSQAEKIDKAEIDRRIDDEWKLHKKDDVQLKSRPIPPDIKNTLYHRVRDALELLKSWQDSQTGPNKETVDTVRACQKHINDIRATCKALPMPDDLPTKAAYVCFFTLIDTLYDLFEGNQDAVDQHRVGFYKSLTNTKLFICGDGEDTPYLPVFPELDNEYQLIWPDKLPDSVDPIRGIALLSNEKASDDSAEDIRKNLLNTIRDGEEFECYSKDRKAVEAIKLCTNTLFDRYFKDDESVCARIGFSRICEDMTKRLEEIKEEKFSALKDANMQLYNEDSEGGTFKKLLDDGMFSAAEDFLNMKPGERSKQSESRNEEFERFWIQDRAQDQDPYCKRISDRISSELKFRDASFSNAWRAVLTKPDLAKGVRDATKGKANEISKLWPLSGGTTSEKIQKLLKELNAPFKFGKNIIDTGKTEQVNNIGVRRMNFEVEMEKLGNADYSGFPPISEFGSKIKSLDVACVLTTSSTNLKANAIGNLVAKLCGSIAKDDTPLLILLNRALSQDEWRQVAQRLKQLNDRQHALVIDWGIVIYALLTEGKVELWNRILQCAAPLHGFNPFLSTSIKVSPELFVGRKDILSKVRDPETPVHFLYGGRQLGKTAIFQFVQDTKQPGDKVVTVDILGMKQTEALRAICQELVRKELPIGNNWEIWGWQELGGWISDYCTKNNLWIQIDEADAFLDDLRNEWGDELKNYATNNDPVQILKRSESGSNGKFRFIFAGKHNVYRFLTWCADPKRSGTIDWRGKEKTPVAVKPFSYSEASLLLDKLKYFGIRFENEEKQEVKEKLRIFRAANYYPGLIHLFCHEAVHMVNQRWDPSKGAKELLTLSEKDISEIINSSEFKDYQRDLFHITVSLDKNNEDSYRCMAYALWMLSYESGGEKRTAFTAEEVKEECKAFQKLDKDHIPTYLDELCELSILKKVDDEIANQRYEGRYDFKREAFADYLFPKGSTDHEDIMYEFYELESNH